jgi:hypothetical protein
MQIIQHQELASGQSSITFSSIPQTYTDLLLVFSARSERTGVGTDDVIVQLNSSSSNQSTRILWGTGSTAQSLTDTQPLIGEYPTSTNTASTFGSYQVYIPNYTSANAKSFSADGVGENNGTTSYQSITAGLYNSVSAITSILIKTGSGSNLSQYTSATLYGITKGSDGTTTVS